MLQQVLGLQLVENGGGAAPETPVGVRLAAVDGRAKRLGLEQVVVVEAQRVGHGVSHEVLHRHGAADGDDQRVAFRVFCHEKRGAAHAAEENKKKHSEDRKQWGKERSAAADARVHVSGVLQIGAVGHRLQPNGGLVAAATVAADVWVRPALAVAAARSHDRAGQSGAKRRHSERG